MSQILPTHQFYSRTNMIFQSNKARIHLKAKLKFPILMVFWVLCFFIKITQKSFGTSIERTTIMEETVNERMKCKNMQATE